ncbi:MAG TPA: hypothetical protein VFO07_02260, partial [Roseiflexaceae bacterium]|nr:hypothetical protein [Roseiflexaceae bacterium]
MRYKRSISWAMLLALLIAALTPPRAFAHGGHQAAGMQTFTQMVGPYELAITVEFPLSVPAPLYLTLVSQQALAGTTITFRAAPRGQSFDGAPTAQVQGIDIPTIYFSELPIDRAGDWDIEVRASGPAGSGVALLPVTVSIEPLPVSSIALFAAIGTLIVLMVASVLLSVIFQRRQQALPPWMNWVIGQGIFACIIVAVIFGIQQASAQIQSATTAASTAAAGRPHANMVVQTEPVAPTAGQPLTMTLELSDGSTGLPVEDIVPHHEALLHLVILSADGADFAHVHPARVGPGQYVIPFTPARPGHYSAYAEIQRQDSGTQVIARDFEVGGVAAGPIPPAPPGLGPREVDGMQVNVTSSVTPLTAGRQATFTFNFSADGAPVVDLQPWLGMAGHLIARRTDGAIFAHIHAAEQMPPSDPILAAGTI